MSRKTNKTITAVGMAALMTAAGVLTAMAAQAPCRKRGEQAGHTSSPAHTEDKTQ